MHAKKYWKQQLVYVPLKRWARAKMSNNTPEGYAARSWLNRKALGKTRSGRQKLSKNGTSVKPINGLTRSG